MSEEVWKPVVGYEGHYEVSNIGRVRCVKAFKKSKMTAPRVLKHHVDKQGRLEICLTRPCKRKTYKISRLVLEAFVCPRPHGLHGAHLNGNPADNRVENLAWVPHIENMAHKKLHGTQTFGELHGPSKLTNDQVRAIRALLADGVPQKDIGAEFGVTEKAISAIKTGRNWKDVK